MNLSLTAKEAKVIRTWETTTPSIPGNSVPGLDYTVSHSLRPLDSVRELYREMFGFEADPSFNREELAFKLRTLNSAIEAADRRCLGL